MTDRLIKIIQRKEREGVSRRSSNMWVDFRSSSHERDVFNAYLTIQ